MIYFDHNSTTPYSPSVRAYLEQGIVRDWYNPSSVYPQSQVLHQKIRECRRFVADFLNCSPKHLFFTSGGTESINTILSLETLRLNRLSTFVTSPLEHHATIKKIDYLSQSIRPYWIFSNEQGEINLDELEEFCLKNSPSLLSFLSSNNETGVITDIKSISKIARKYNCLVHVDAVQSLGKMPVDLEKWDVDFASFSGHKIGAMKGIGLLYARKPFSPLMYGGGQERGLRPGTLNYPAIQSFKLAVQDIDLNKQEDVRTLRDDLENQLQSFVRIHAKSEDYEIGLPDQKINSYSEEVEFFKINCKKASRLPNTSSIYCRGTSNQVAELTLAQKGICIASGSACNTGSPEPSHVMSELALLMDEDSPKDYARSCIRVSLSSSNTKKEIDFLAQSLKDLHSINIRPNEPSLRI